MAESPTPLPPRPPMPERILSFREILASAVLSAALVAFAAHLEPGRAWLFCLLHAWAQSYVIFRAGRWTRRHLLPRLGVPEDPPLWRAAVIVAGMSLAVVFLQGLDRAVLGPLYLAQGWLPAESLDRFNDAVLLVRLCVTVAISGLVSAQLSHTRLETTLRSEAEAMRAAGEARRQMHDAELRRQLAEVEARTAKQLATEAELTALKMQINPHFLFNTLGSIAVLARLDGPRAAQMAEKLAEIFRYALQASKRPSATLGEELEFLRAYFEIEKARFGPRLDLSLDVPVALHGLAVPNLLLQPMVENAIQHAFQGMVNGWRVEVRAEAHDGFVDLTVADNGRGFEGRDPYLNIGRGTALKNIDERLRRFYGPETRLGIEQREPTGALFRIRVPLATAARVRPARLSP